MVVYDQQDKKRKERIVIIIAFCVLFLSIVIGVIIILLWLDKKGNDLPPSDDNAPTEVIEDKSNEYNRLLQLVNNEASEYSYLPATEVISFLETAEYFSITACYDTKIYNYSIDRTSITDNALTYFLEHDPSSSMSEILDSYNKGDIPSYITSKYLTGDDVKHHTVSYTCGLKSYITSTIYNSTSKKVSVIYKVDTDTLINNSVTPTEIDNSNQTLYSLYRYIATR